MITSSIDEYIDLVNWIQKTVVVKDTEGKNMIYKKFDTSRLV